MRRRIITEGNLRITKQPYRSVLACAALLLAVVSGPAGAAATQVDHIRGIILGTTMSSLDVGTPARVDIHLEMALEPSVAIAEPGVASALVRGAFVSVIADTKNDRARCVVIVPEAAHVFPAGRTAWDAPGAASTLTSGRITRVDAASHPSGFTVGYGGASRHFTLAKTTPIVALRPSTRAALISPYNVFVFATPPTTDLTDSVRSIIVAGPALALPF